MNFIRRMFSNRQRTVAATERMTENPVSETSAMVQTQTLASASTDIIHYNQTIPFTFRFLEKRPVMVVKVYDGDTITVATKLPAYVGVGDPDTYYRFNVRLAGIDTPELKSKNVHERELAERARAALGEMVIGRAVMLANISTEKYGRILADVYTADNIHVNARMIEAGHAVAYNGGTKTAPWRQTT